MGQYGVIVPSKSLPLLKNQMQNELEELLRAQFNDRNVIREDEHVNLTFRDSRHKADYPVKIESEGFPRLAIRNAIGQLLEYAFFTGLRKERKLRLPNATPESNAWS